MLGRTRRGPFVDGFQLVLLRFNSCGVHDVTAKVDLREEKFALGAFHEELVFAECLQDCANVLTVFFWARAMNDDVVDVDFAVCAMWAEDVHHCTLKGGRRVAKAKWHYFETKGAMGSAKCCAVLMFRYNANLVIALLEVELGEACRTS